MTTRKLSLTAAVFALLPAALHAQAPTPYPTTVSNYVYVGAAGMNNAATETKIFTTADPANPSFTGTGITITGATTKINGVGLNGQDGFLYGISLPNAAASATTTLYRIGSNGVAVATGIIPSPVMQGATVSLINTTAGFVDNDGNYYFSAYTYSGNPFSIPYNADLVKFYLGRIDNVASLSAGVGSLTPVYTLVTYAVSDPFRSAIQSFFTNFNYLNPGSSDGGFEDIAQSPVTGKLYTYYSYPDPVNPTQLLHRPAMIDAVTGEASTVGTVTNTSPNREIAGAYFNAFGDFFVLFTNGEYSQVNLTTGALIGLISTGLPLAQNNNLRGDLASNLISNPLPVQLVSFTGTAAANSNNLSWATAGEIGFAGFTIERSTNGSGFIPVGYVAASGHAATYRFTDAAQPEALYRLKLENTDGSNGFSATVRLARTAAGNNDIRVFPTPAPDGVVYCTAPAGCVVRVVNSTGALVYQSTTTGETTSIQLPAASGLYVVQVTGANGASLATQRIVR